jgi:intein/homing endonuclease
MAYETVVGRNRSDLEKYGNAAAGFIGRHIVGEGEDMHLTTKVLLDFMRPHMVLITGKRGTGKCIDGDTEITLDDGRSVPIKDLEKYDQKIYGLNDRLKIAPLQKGDFFKRNVDMLLRVTLRSGREIKLTPEHPLLTVGGWCPAGQLPVGSRIATPRKIRVFGNEPMKENEIKILAYLIAEGHLSNSFVLFSNMDEEICSDFYESVKEFDSGLEITEHSKKGCFRVVKKKGSASRSASSSLRTWLDDIGIYGKLSKEKSIPDCIFRLPNHQLALFLNRMFSCDGSIYKHKATHGRYWEISYSTASEKMAHQMQHLLLRFEILSKIRKKKTMCGGRLFDSFELVILSGNFVNFINSIGFFGKKQRRQQDALKETTDLIRATNVDTIPKEIWSIYRPENWAEIGRSLGYSVPKCLRTSVNYSPTRQKLLNIAQLDRNEQMLLLASSDIFWDEIIRIEELTGDFVVYDISVPTHHNFVANDIIVHNSYDAAVIAEEISRLPEEHRRNLAVVFIDTMGIFWSMKAPNDQQVELLREWKLEPKAMENVRMYVPYAQKGEFEKAGLPVDGGITIAPHEFSAEEWRLAFGLSATEPAGVAIEKTVNALTEAGGRFTLEDMIDRVRDDAEIAADVKDALANMLVVAAKWGVFGTEGTSIDELVVPGTITAVDVSRLRASEAWSVRNFVVAILARKIYQRRLIARKEEEVAKLELGEERAAGKSSFPMVWLMIDEAHNFAPADRPNVSTEPLTTIAKQGREPGVSLAVITQMPNKLHQDILSQCDVVFAHRLTSRDDVESLHAVMQTYMPKELQQYIDELPRQPGACMILDDNLEKIFKVQIRPRLSWHAGGTATIV